MSTLETERLRLRRCSEVDVQALLEMLSDEDVARFLPFEPMRTRRDAERVLDEKFLDRYRRADAGEGPRYGVPLDARWAVEERDSGSFIGFVTVGCNEAHDVGYALRRESWGRGYAREALRAAISWARARGLGFLTATHDVDNLRSGAVMDACDMTARYIYREQRLPKKPIVTFCMHQIDLEPGAAEYQGYWNRWPDHWRAQGCSQRQP